MRPLCLQIGSVRLHLWRPIKGGLCPLNVPGKNWTILPHLSDSDQQNNVQHDWSPKAVASVVLSALVSLLRP
jgi:hypothetical protein